MNQNTRQNYQYTLASRAKGYKQIGSNHLYVGSHLDTYLDSTPCYDNNYAVDELGIKTIFKLYKCNKARCGICNVLNFETTVKSLVGKRKFPILLNSNVD